MAKKTKADPEYLLPPFEHLTTVDWAVIVARAEARVRDAEAEAAKAVDAV